MSSHANARQPPETILYLADQMESKNVPKDDDIFELILNACLASDPSVRRSLIRTKCHAPFNSYLQKCKEDAVSASTPFPPLFPSATPFTYFRLTQAYAQTGDLAAAVRSYNERAEFAVWMDKEQLRRHVVTCGSEQGFEHRLPPPARFCIRDLAKVHGITGAFDSFSAMFGGIVKESSKKNGMI